LVVFDFDGTLSARDANMEFGKYCFGRSVRPWLFLPVMALAAAVKLFNPGGVWWRQAMRSFLTADMVKRFAPEFIEQHKSRRFGWAKEQVAAERAAGNKVILISAGPDYLIPFLVKDIQFDGVVCSVMDKNRPWKYKFLCWGKNKVIAMDEWAIRHRVAPRLAKSYSDSKSDMPLMEIAIRPVWINPRTGMRIN
jgi:phosphoserine phosphatase